MLIAFHKPYGVLSQFTPDGSPNRPLAEFGFPNNVYPIGRLDADSEGLLLLSDEPAWNARLLEPRHAHEREYWVQVERIPGVEDLEQLAAGVLVQGSQATWSLRNCRQPPMWIPFRACPAAWPCQPVREEKISNWPRPTDKLSSRETALNVIRITQNRSLATTFISEHVRFATTPNTGPAWYRTCVQWASRGMLRIGGRPLPTESTEHSCLRLQKRKKAS